MVSLCTVPTGLRNEFSEYLFPTLKRGANKLRAYGAFALFNFGAFALFNFGAFALFNFGAFALFNFDAFALFNFGAFAQTSLLHSSINSASMKRPLPV
jgi:hypothetical protein